MKVILTENQYNFIKENLMLESQGTNIIQILLEKLKKPISDLLEKYEESFEKSFEREMSDYDREYAKLMITYDMIRSIEKYTQPTDELVSVEANTSRKGNLEIFAKIKRDDKVYQLNTEVIVASGAIQRAHYRYLTKTNLPKTGNSEITKQFTEKIKKMSKIEKIQNDISNFEKRINTTEKELEDNQKKSKDEIMDILREKDSNLDITWDEIVRRGADRNYKGKSDFEESRKNYIQSQIDFWKSFNIKSKIEHIKSLQKEVNKMNSKLEQLKNNE
jgi:hypothetical protein